MKTSLTLEQEEARWKAMLANPVHCPGLRTAPTNEEIIASLTASVKATAEAPVNRPKSEAAPGDAKS